MPLKRYSQNPILTRQHIPEISPELTDVSSVFNPGAIIYQDKYLLILRVQNRGRESFMMLAESENGYNFTVRQEKIIFNGIEKVEEVIYHLYDARITQIDNQYFVMFAMDMEGKCCLGLAKTLDFKNFDFMGIVADYDCRNGVLFPEKINGRYVRFERPNGANLENGVTSGDQICISYSDDLNKWDNPLPVASGNWHYWDERIGSGPPPIKTRQGWLHVYHGIATHFASSNIYQAGVMLLDLEDPSKINARGKYNILEPREIYELTGQVPNVVFPSGMIVEEYDSDGFAKPESVVKIYYGAADTVVGLAETTIQELIEDCYAGFNNG